MEQAGKMIYLVANWKSCKTLNESLLWLESMKEFKLNELIKVIVCPPFPYLNAMYKHIVRHWLPIKLGAQDISAYPFGAYTGAVAAPMLNEFITYTIVGHSERRRYFHETDQEVANKASQALENNLTPVVCIDEPYLEPQINVLNDMPKEKLMFAYEPLAAIGSGKPDTPEHAQSIAERIKAMVQADVPVLYGGSVTAENIKSFTTMPAISGALVGGASLDAEDWKVLVTQVGV
jgi:triosephosphate isomerase